MCDAQIAARPDVGRGLRASDATEVAIAPLDLAPMRDAGVGDLVPMRDADDADTRLRPSNAPSTAVPIDMTASNLRPTNSSISRTGRSTSEQCRHCRIGTVNYENRKKASRFLQIRKETVSAPIVG